MAEKEGKTVDLLVVPGVDPFDAMVQTAAKLKASRLVTGVSTRMDSEELARRIGLAWEKLPEPRHPFSLEVISPGRPSVYVNLGPHPPRLWPEDLDRLHDLWLQLSDRFGSKLHHRDVIGVALRRLEKDLSREQEAVIEDLSRELRKDEQRRQLLWNAVGVQRLSRALSHPARSVYDGVSSTNDLRPLFVPLRRGFEVSRLEQMLLHHGRHSA